MADQDQTQDEEADSAQYAVAGSIPDVEAVRYPPAAQSGGLRLDSMAVRGA